MIYFDYNSTAPYSPSVRHYLEQDILQGWQNPSAVYPQARVLDQQIKKCRQTIADFLNCSPRNLFFTSGGTEAINTVLSPDTLKLNGLHSVISSPLEHHATLKKIEYLKTVCSVRLDSRFRGNDKFGDKNDRKKYKHKSKHKHDKAQEHRHGYVHTQDKEVQEHRHGYAHTQDKAYENSNNKVPIYWVGNNEQGEVNLSELEELCACEPCSLVSLLSANNETGVITNIKEVSRIARKYNCLVHVDAVQSLGKMLVDLTDWGVDFVSFSGHKIGAMKGVGLLYARKPFVPLMYGGGQERSLRAGTYNFPAIYSLQLAIQDIDLQKWEDVRKLKDYFESSLLQGCDYLIKGKTAGIASAPFKIHCQGAKRLPNTSNIYCMGKSNQAVLSCLNQKGICASAGSACNTGSPEPSHVVVALGICEDLNPRDYARSCFRISLSPHNTKSEVEILIRALRELYS